MPINNPNPITIPAVAATQADAVWVRNLTISAPTLTGKITATIQLVPYSSITGVVLNNQSKVISIPDVAAAASTDADLAAAFAAVSAAVQKQIIAKNVFAPSTPPTP